MSEGTKAEPTPGRLEDVYLIWSHEHQGWWRPGGIGYTGSMSEAGQFTRAKALSICLKAVPGTADRIGALPELPVRLEDVLAFTSAYLAEHPDRGGPWK